jgi:predicted nucleotidyltransferase
LRLFGSKARGDDKPDSDIDMLVIVASDDWHIRDKVYDVATDMLLQADVCKQRRLLVKADSISFAKKAPLLYTMLARMQLQYE